MMGRFDLSLEGRLVYGHVERFISCPLIFADLKLDCGTF
jgi:hypothetical protein